MTHAFKIVTFQAAVLAASAFVMTTVATMTKAATPAAASVQIGNFTFKSPIVTVKPGTTVTWTNGDDIPHTVVSKDGVFKSKVLDSGDKFSFTFAKPGQFGYFCSIHPHMTGTIIVKA
ncbi:MAG: cupredoxin domain-containing protein [Sphingomicrobium sp.]